MAHPPHRTDELQHASFLLILAVVSLLMAVIVWPFAQPLLWAALAAIMFQPLYRWMLRKLGGRRNPALMKALGGALEEPVRPVEVAGWDGDALEAQAFGVLAARVARGLPLSFPGTTGAPRPLTGGRIIGALL